MYVSAPNQELSLRPFSPMFSSFLPVLRIEVWVPSHLRGGAELSRAPWKWSVGCVPDTGRLSMHWMRSQTRWSVMGVWVKWVVCLCVCLCDCTFIFSFLVVVVSFFGCVFACEVAFAHAFTHIFAHAYVSVGGKEKNRLWCFRGHAYGGLAVIHSCG